jgi:hypothetical protein
VTTHSDRAAKAVTFPSDRWSPSIGISGHFESESVVTFERCRHSDNRFRSIPSTHSGKTPKPDAFDWNRWTDSIGIPGRFRSESVDGFSRCRHPLFALLGFSRMICSPRGVSSRSFRRASELQADDVAIPHGRELDSRMKDRSHPSRGETVLPSSFKKKVCPARSPS